MAQTSRPDDQIRSPKSAETKKPTQTSAPEPAENVSPKKVPPQAAEKTPSRALPTAAKHRSPQAAKKSSRQSAPRADNPAAPKQAPKHANEQAPKHANEQAPKQANEQAPEEATKQAKKHYERGRKYHEQGKYRQAAGEYHQAYQWVQNPLLIFNIGQAYRLAGDYQKAIFYYRAYLQLNPSGPGAEDAQRFATELAATSAQRAAAATADRNSQASPVEITQPGGILAISASTARHLRYASMASAGIGTVALIIGSKYSLDARQLSNAFAGVTWSPAYAALLARGAAVERNMLVAYGIAATALAAGGVLGYLGWYRDPARRSGQIALLPTRSGLLITGRF